MTGGTGVLGRELVHRLAERAEVRVLSRRQHQMPGIVRGDLDTGEGLADAVADVDVIAHCASAADYRRPERDIEQAEKLLAAVADRRPHLVYISIVGIDRIPFGYYRAKLGVERLIMDSGLPWTILRTTQFHDLALLFLTLATKGPFAFVPRGFCGQPVDVREVAHRMAELVLGKPAGRVPDLGGPEVLNAEEWTRMFLRETGRRRLLLRIPLPGRVARGFRDGHHIVTDGDHGRRTFADYLRDRVKPDGTVEPPYDLKRRK